MQRFWTNALAELTIVPRSCSAVQKIFPRLEDQCSRWGEAALLAVQQCWLRSSYSAGKAVSPAAAPHCCMLLSHWGVWPNLVCGLSVPLSLSLALISTGHNARDDYRSRRLPARQHPGPCKILFCVVAAAANVLSAVMAEARRTQESLRRMSGSLIETQEAERYRMGRELHDDIVNVSQCWLSITTPPPSSFTLPEVRSRMGELRSRPRR